mmetsp:Transcript_12879/g.19565  ORF Transcript_12879/g.19565 Transcript_12879/m.19565 type:complete len:579 (-) Transcript_12879:1614-3350(-)
MQSNNKKISCSDSRTINKNHDYTSAFQLPLLLRHRRGIIETLLVFMVIGINSLRQKHTADSLLSLHDNKHYNGTGDNNSPLCPIHSFHTKYLRINTRGVGDENLENKHNHNRVPSVFIALEDGSGVRWVVSKTCTEGDCNSSKIKGIKGLCTFFFQCVTHVLNQEVRTNNDSSQRNSSNDNSKEKESANQTLSNTTRRQVHDTRLRWFDSANKTECNGTNQVGIKHLNRRQGSLVKTQKQTEKDTQTLCVVNGRIDKKNLTKVIPNSTALLHSLNNGGKVVIGQHHLCSFTSYISTFLTHCNTHVRSLESGRIINTITGHTTDFVLSLKGIHNLNLVLRRSTGKHVVLLHNTPHLLIRHSVKFRTSNGFRMIFIKKSKLSSNGKSSVSVVTSDHSNTNTSSVSLLDSLHTLWTRRIHDSTETNHSEPRFFTVTDKFRTKLISLRHLRLGNTSTSQSQHTKTMGTENSDLLNPVHDINRLHVFFSNLSTLGLVLTKRNHTIWCTLDMDDKFIQEIRSIIFQFCFMYGSHKLVFRAERYFGDNGGAILHSRDINTSKVGSTEDGKFGRVTNFSFASTIGT